MIMIICCHLSKSYPDVCQFLCKSTSDWTDFRKNCHRIQPVAVSCSTEQRNATPRQAETSKYVALFYKKKLLQLNNNNIVDFQWCYHYESSCIYLGL